MAVEQQRVDQLQTRIEQLQEERMTLQRRLDDLDGHRWLSAEEQLERKRYQKLKLAMKDEIETLKRMLGGTTNNATEFAVTSSP